MGSVRKEHTMVRPLHSDDDQNPTMRQVHESGLPGDPLQPVSAENAEAPGERYETRMLLGQGGMGDVTLAHDRLIGRDVALKRLRRDKPDSQWVQRRFAREARVQGQLEHPSIVPVYDLGKTDDGAPWFTMKRVHGVSLASVLKSTSSDPSTGVSFNRRRILSAFSQICLAVQYAHERGVVHRDIKPENIMLGHYGEVVLLDWGIAKVLTAGEQHEEHTPTGPLPSDDCTREGEVLGTIGYLSPEQATGVQAHVDGRSDIYALGAILFEILTLTPLHENGPVALMLRRIRAGIEARPSVRAPQAHVPPELEAICVTATQRDPGLRYQSARELHDAIEAFLDGDRDVQLRRESAKRHAELARAAAERALGAVAADENAHRTTALREVGQALALDAENRDALRTLVRVMTTPPRTIPPEVDEAQRRSQEHQIKRGAALGAIAYLYLLVNVLVMYRNGVRDWIAFSMSLVFWGGAALTMLATVFRPRYGGLLTALILSVIATVLATASLGPLLVEPSLLATLAVLYSMMRKWKLRVAVIVIVSTGWAVSLFGEAWGLFPKSLSALDGGILIHSPTVDLPRVFTTPNIFLAFLALIVLPAVVVGALRSQYAAADTQLRLQAWQLHQLVPLASADTAKE
jgi:serine/threonine-protein kinase